ncbi:helix-hairpin-helix domain-containing protein [Desulfoferrobacter suflitae]|uniref:helix-hairpin-helix domain-containing protein n=1 Tax=Desulfoferrobacter suflitae TaxID=2865782 RepID=UPI0021646CE3|nr:helix-hairpin-helix domain-containing protein [Desulfoferrobacter suflitae]MCK8602032.1 helix-hairpin-helix domain-containing protein [Desulfoferrobacter suflitae]
MKKRTEYADKKLKNDSLSGQWAAVSLLAALIFCLLLGRYYRKLHFSPEPSSAPVICTVQGAVKRPGVYVLADNAATLFHAVEAAGGLRGGKPTEMGAALLRRRLITGSLVQIRRNAQGEFDARVEPGSGRLRFLIGQKIDPNRAAKDELMLIPLMQPEFADAIIARRASRPWQRLSELREIPGIGPKTVEKWRKYLEVEAGSSGR